MSETPAKAPRKGDGRVAFLAHKDLFRSLLEAGHPQRAIYDDHCSDLGISYSQFNRYVGQYLIEKETTHGHQNEAGSASASPPPDRTGQPGGHSTGGSGLADARSQPKPAAKPVAGKFSHDPNSGNDREDLI